MKTYHFLNEQIIPIADGPANQIASTIEVEGTGGSINDLNVKLDIKHTYTDDLEIRLQSPDGTSVLLVSGVGGSRNDFQETTFDDDATISINNGNAPFRGIFKPAESLGQFNGLAANGVWRLEINDRAAEDGGTLNKWELEIITDEQEVNTGPFIFNNQTAVPIAATGANTVASIINIPNLGDIKVAEICVAIDVAHTYTGDLTISLVSPDNKEVILVNSQGRSGDNFQDTIFDNNATTTISNASAPFTGRFQPEGNLNDFQGINPSGDWTLVVKDQANLDGGSLNAWSITLKSNDTPQSQPLRPFKIEVRFSGTLSDSQKAIFQVAADRWSEVIVGNLPSISTDIGIVDDLVIDAEGVAIDGPGRILGQAGPTQVRPGSLLPARGIMQFDSADLQTLENEGELLDVIIHEMGHVLGIGTLWKDLRLIQGSGTDNPEFRGENAMREYAVLKNIDTPTLVPIANTGGAGTREGHWRESVFDTELMTGFDDPGRNALSRLTIASLQDLGYQVDYDKADAFILPFSLLSSVAVESKQAHQCRFNRPGFKILPFTNLVS